MKKTLSILAALAVATFFVGAAFAQAPAAPAAPGAPAPPPPPPKVEPPQSQEAEPTAEGKKIANFNLPFAFENKMAKFDEVLKAAGNPKVAVLTFTNTSCAACQDEMAVLTNLKAKYGKDMFIVAVVTDYNAKRIAENLGEDTKKSMTFLSDPFFTVPPLYGFNATPASAFIKGDKVLSLESGYLPTAEARQALREKIDGYMK